MEEPWHIAEYCICTQAMTTLQQYEIPLIQEVVQVFTGVGKISCPIPIC